MVFCNCRKRSEEPQQFQEFNNNNFMSLSSQIREYCNINIKSMSINNGELEIKVFKNDLIKMSQFLKDNPNCLFDQLTDLTAIDYPNKKNRFLIIYQFLSVTHNQRIRLLTEIREDQTIPSIHNIFLSAIWAEREIWDMFGIYVDGHPDLRRILTDYGFQGHPLRKDFPLTGFSEVNYDPDNRKVVYNKVQLTQDYRDFDFNSPWGDPKSMEIKND